MVKMNNPAVQMLLQRMSKINPQGYEVVNNMMKNGENPMTALQKMLGGKSSEQLNQFFGQAKNMGFPDELLSQVQNGIKQ